MIDVCEQSPVIIQFQSSSPVHTEPVDGTFFSFIRCLKVEHGRKVAGIKFPYSSAAETT